MTAANARPKPNGPRRRRTPVEDPFTPPAAPHNLAAEQAVLGGVFSRNEVIRQIDLSSEDFFDARNKAVWSAMAECDAEGMPIDELTVQTALERAGKWQLVGGIAYVGQLRDRVPSTEFTLGYADTVRELARKRRTGFALSQFAARAFEAGADLAEVFAELARFQASEARCAAASRWLDRRDIVGLIRSRSSEPWVQLGLGQSVIAEVRAGGLVTLSGPTGAGKSSLASAIAARFAREQGWVVVLSLELSADEMAGRIVGLTTGTSWGDVLRGALSDQQMLEALPERLVMVEWDGGTIEALDLKLGELRAAHPEMPILFVVDYGQLLHNAAEDVRLRVAANWELGRRVAATHRAVGLFLSQMARSAARAARGGERVGADAVDGGAESAAIERWSSVVLELGLAGPEDQYGRREVALSVAKDRMGRGDAVLPMSYDGASGRWAIVGNARPATELREEARAQNADRKVQAAALAIRQVADQSTEPKTRDQLIIAAQVGKAAGRPAIRLLEDAGVLVEVRVKEPQSSSWKLWTPPKAEAAGIPLVGAEVVS